MNAAFTAYKRAEPEKVSPEPGAARKRRKELDLFAFERDLFDDVVPIGYGKLIRDAKDTIIHASSGKPGHRWVINGRTAGRLIGLTKDERRRLDITTMKAIDETDEERAEYVADGRRKRDREAKAHKRAEARAARPRKVTVAERAKAAGMSRAAWYRRHAKRPETTGFSGETLSVGARIYLSDLSGGATENRLTAASEPAVIAAAAPGAPPPTAPSIEPLRAETRSAPSSSETLVMARAAPQARPLTPPADDRRSPIAFRKTIEPAPNPAEFTSSTLKEEDARRQKPAAALSHPLSRGRMPVPIEILAAQYIKRGDKVVTFDMTGGTIYDRYEQSYLAVAHRKALPRRDEIEHHIKVMTLVSAALPAARAALKTHDATTAVMAWRKEQERRVEELDD